MSYFFQNIKPTNYSDEEEQYEEDPDELRRIIRRQQARGKNSSNHDKHKKQDNHESGNDDDDDLKTLSFGAIKNADSILEKETQKERHQDINSKKPKAFKEEKFEDESDSDSSSDQPLSGHEDNVDSDSDSDGRFFEEDSEDEDSNYNNNGRKNSKKNQRHKHAPTEQSSKRRVSKIRKIDGLNDKRHGSSLYGDIRFEKSTGRATDQSVVRRRYAFLDEYREKEISDLEGLLHDRKFVNKLNDREREDMEGDLKSMKSKLQSIKNQDLEKNIIKEYEDNMNEGNQTRFHLKKADKRKVIQKWKFDHMKARQREKVMERKRKKRLGKEFKQFEFHQNR